MKNRDNRKEWLTISSTDLSLTEEEIIRLYGNRWCIEAFFKSIKSLMKRGTEFQGRSYDMMIYNDSLFEAYNTRLASEK